MFTTAKNELSTALKQVFNLNIKFNDGLDLEYQECVLYVNLETIRGIKTSDTANGIYYLSGTVFLNTVSKCSYTFGLLTDRVANFNKIDGLYFAQNEIPHPPLTTLNFEFYSKPIQLKSLAALGQIEDMDNTVITTGEKVIDDYINFGLIRSADFTIPAREQQTEADIIAGMLSNVKTKAQVISSVWRLSGTIETSY